MPTNFSVISEGSPEFEEETDMEMSKNKSTLGYIMENPCIGTESLQEKNELLKNQILCFRFILSGSIMNPKYNKVKTSITAICTHSRRVSKRTQSVAQKHKKYVNTSGLNATKNHELLN